MKLTKQGIDNDAWRKQYIKATEDCWECPCCGESNKDKSSLMFYTINIVGRRNIAGTTLLVDVFKCDKCHAEWESSPYRTKEHFRTLKEHRL